MYWYFLEKQQYGNNMELFNYCSYNLVATLSLTKSIQSVSNTQKLSSLLVNAITLFYCSGKPGSIPANALHILHGWTRVKRELNITNIFPREKEIAALKKNHPQHANPMKFLHHKICHIHARQYDSIALDQRLLVVDRVMCTH